MRIGDGRVSRDQHPEAQHDALTAAGCEQILIDQASGRLTRLPELERALTVAGRSGDQLVVTKLDRLGRSPEHLIDLSRDLHSRGVDLVVLDQGIDTSTAVGPTFFQILGSIAEFEHALMPERTRDGLAAARARGRTGGPSIAATAGGRQSMADTRALRAARTILLKFDADLDLTVLDDTKYDYRVRLVPTTASQAGSQAAVEFVNLDAVTNEQRQTLIQAGRALAR